MGSILLLVCGKRRLGQSQSFCALGKNLFSHEVVSRFQQAEMGEACHVTLMNKTLLGTDLPPASKTIATSMQFNILLDSRWLEVRRMWVSSRMFSSLFGYFGGPLLYRNERRQVMDRISRDG